MKRLMMIAAAVAVLAVAVVAVGGAYAQEGDGSFGSFLARVADKLGVSEDELQTAVDEAKGEALDEAVAEGVLTEAQAERIQENGFGFRAGFRGGGPLGFGGGGWHKPDIKEAVTTVLGITEEELEAELEDGETSLADVAEAQGMSVDALTSGILSEVQSQLDADVDAGDLTQDQADNIFERLQEKIDDIVTREGGLGCPHRENGAEESEEEVSEITA